MDKKASNRDKKIIVKVVGLDTDDFIWLDGHFVRWQPASFIQSLGKKRLQKHVCSIFISLSLSLKSVRGAREKEKKYFKAN